MSSEPNYDDERFDPQPRPKKQGMSTGMKIIIIILCIGGGLFLLCCGGVVYFVMKVKDGVSDNPDTVIATTKEIIGTEVPPKLQLQPRMSMIMDVPFIPKFRMVVYSGAGAGSQLTLVEMVDPSLKAGELNQQQEQEFQEQMGKQGQGPKKLEKQEVTTRQIDIRGKKTPVQFIKGENPETKVKYRQVTTNFAGKRENSVVMLILQIPEDQYQEEEVLKLLGSIK